MLIIVELNGLLVQMCITNKCKVSFRKHTNKGEFGAAICTQLSWTFCFPIIRHWHL